MPSYRKLNDTWKSITVRRTVARDIISRSLDRAESFNCVHKYSWAQILRWRDGTSREVFNLVVNCTTQLLNPIKYWFNHSVMMLQEGRTVKWSKRFKEIVSLLKTTSFRLDRQLASLQKTLPEFMELFTRTDDILSDELKMRGNAAKFSPPLY